MGWVKKSLLTAAVAASALGSAAPATAGGGRYYGHSGRGHYGRSDVYVSNHYYYGSRDYRHRHRRGGLSGGEAALLAAGIIGGAILIDRALESDRADDRYGYERRPYPQDRYERYPAPRDDYYRRDDRRYDDGRYGSLGGDLAGGRASPGEYNYGAAYNDCKAETREAARESGVTVALPAKPERIVPIEQGGAVRFEASYLASDGGGGEWRRRMVCEADADGVRFLELV